MQNKKNLAKISEGRSFMSDLEELAIHIICIKKKVWCPSMLWF